MWRPTGPLRQILNICARAYEVAPIKAWVDMGTHSMKDYAIWLIMKYPWPFIRYYLIPNAKNAFYPDSPEAVYTYINVKPGNENVVGWFGVPEDMTMQPRSNWLADRVQPVLSWIEVFTWLAMLFGAVVMLLSGWKPPRENRLVLWLLFLFGLIYYGTTVFASPIALRYWLPMHAVKLSFAWLAVRPEAWAAFKARLRKIRWLDRTVSAERVRNASILYVALPLLAFCIGFLRWYYALPAAAVLLAALYFALRPGMTGMWMGSFTWRTVLAAFLIALAWSYFGGMNGFWYQSSDWDCRNALYFDLIRYGWPVMYDQSGGSLVYYIGFWLPPAAVAKVFLVFSENVALMAGRMLLWLWSSLGITLVALLLFQVLGVMGRKQKIFAMALLVLFSGMDLLGAVLEHTFDLMMQPRPRPSGPHLEWWMHFKCQFSSNTTLLFWVFNQTIVAWVVTLLFLKDDDPGNYVLYGVACLFCAPFACVGLAVLMAVKACMFFTGNIRRLAVVFRSIFTPQNLLALLLLVPVVFYLLSANAVGGETASVGGAEGVSFFSGKYFSGKFLLFILLEVGVYLLLVLSDKYRNPLYYALWATFLIAPYFHIGKSLDFPMRATIPALFVLMVYTGRYLKEHLKSGPWAKRICAWILLVCLVIGTGTPAVEFYRGFYHTGKEQKIRLEDQSLMTFNAEKANYNFITAEPENHFFFRHLAKQRKQ
jgi:hypothetical protein